MFVYFLTGLGYELVSTGGSANAIEGAGVPVTRVEELTGFPEMLDGKTSSSSPFRTWQSPMCLHHAAEHQQAVNTERSQTRALLRCTCFPGDVATMNDLL